MKAVAAVIIAAIVLFAIDSEYNDGRYTRVIERATTSIISR